MAGFIALLRGINVSGKKKILMPELRSCLEELDLDGVRTYIQSGNILFRSGSLTKEEAGALIEGKIREKYGFEVPVLVKSPEDLEFILKNNPLLEDYPDSDRGLYLTFLYRYPTADKLEDLRHSSFPGERFSLRGDCVFLHFERGYGRAKINNNYLETRLGVRTTTRNWRTVRILYQWSVQ